MMNYVIDFLRILLLPLSLLYGWAMEVRNRLFDWGILQAQKFSFPVIAIGNLTAGGSGKTPFTILMAELLRRHFPCLAIVSRGYRRQSKGLQVVSNGQTIRLTVQEAGDEPYLMARRLPGVWILVAEKRAEALRYLQNETEVEAVLLDDAFQHRGVRRDIDVLLRNPTGDWKEHLPLPSGLLREFKFNQRRADILVINEKFERSKEEKKADYPQPVYFVHSRLDSLVSHDFSIEIDLNALMNQTVVAFAGIAHPQNFRRALQQAGVKVHSFESFSDHHLYSVRDMQRLIQTCQKGACRILLCTEKDLVKIGHLYQALSALQENGLQLYGVRLKLELDNRDKLVKNVLSLLDKQG